MMERLRYGPGLYGDHSGVPRGGRPTAQEYLERSAAAALELFDRGQRVNAVTSFLSDVREHPGTAWIADDLGSMELLHTASHGVREDFEQCLLGFATGDTLST